jgi:hypothetical protein
LKRRKMKMSGRMTRMSMKAMKAARRDVVGGRWGGAKSAVRGSFLLAM